MSRILPSFSAALAACTPSPQDTAMRSSGPVSAPVSTIATPGSGEASGEARRESQGPTAQDRSGYYAGVRTHAAQGPIPEPVSAAVDPAPAPLADSSVETLGRRTLSTAFVRIGPDGYLTVELRDGRVLVLREVVMHARKYCGVQMLSGAPEGQYCGRYADVAAARPGDAAKS